MGFKKTIKRISALGVGATMVGATIFGAMAADLSAYPSQYVKDGKFTGVMVVGDKAAAEDVIGVSDIAVSLQFAATKPAEAGSSSVSVEGDAWKVGTGSKMLELSEDLATGSSRETIRNITTFIDDSELNALASGTVSNGKGDAPYNQFLYLLGPGTGVGSGYVVYVEDDTDVTADFLYFRSSQEIGRYLLEFTTALESDVDDSAGAATTTGTYLTDFEDTDITMFGRPYTIVQARRVVAAGSQVKLVLMGGATKDTLLEGATKTYTIGGKDYEVTVDFVDSNSAKLTINGQPTRDLLEGESDKVSDGTTVGVSEILYQDYAGGVHSVTFFLGAQKMELKDTDIKDVDSTNNIKIDDDTIDNAWVVIEGTDDNSTFKINRIHVNMTADDDFYVPAGGKLSENPDLDEPQVLFTSNWDIEYKGLAEQPIETVKIAPSGSKKYNLEFLDGDGEKVSLPLAEADAASSLEFGEIDKALINFENTTITKDDYIVLTDTTAGSNRGSRKTYILQYKGADKSSSDNKLLKFKNLGKGDTIEQTYSVPASVTDGPDGALLATLKVGGADYVIYNRSTITANDFSIVMDLDASGAVVNKVKTGSNNSINITTFNGMEIGIVNGSQDGGSEVVVVSFKTPDNSRDGGSTEDNVETLQATDFVVNVTSTSDTEVTFSLLTGKTGGQAGTRINTRTPSGETNIAYAYSSYGTFFKHETPSGDPAVLTIQYPKKQREALVYITAKGSALSTTSTASSGGAVSIQRIDVGATKLASEVPNIKAVNSILVGGPCANAAAATVMGNPADCTEGFTPGVGKIQVWDVGTGNVAMLVAGYSAADTRNAATVVANYGDYKSKLAGAVVEVTKTQSGTLDVSKPAEKPAMEEPAADDAAAE